MHTLTTEQIASKARNIANKAGGRDRWHIVASPPRPDGSVIVLCEGAARWLWLAIRQRVGGHIDAAILASCERGASTTS